MNVVVNFRRKMARSLRTNPFSDKTGILQRQTSGTHIEDTADLFTHFSRIGPSEDSVHVYESPRTNGANTPKRRTAPPVSSLSPDRVEITTLNDTSMLDLSTEQNRSQIDPFHRYVSTILSF